MKLKITCYFLLALTILQSTSGQAPYLNLEFARSMEGTTRPPGQHKLNYGYDMVVDQSGNSYITGIFSDSMDFDPGPGKMILKTKSVGHDLFIQKLDVHGNLIWVRTIGGQSDDYGRAIKLDQSGNIYVAGYFKDSVDFDPGPSTAYLTTAKYKKHSFILKLSNNGNFIWVKSITGLNSNHGLFMEIDAYDDLYITGNFLGTIDLDPGPGTHQVTSGAPTNHNVYILKLNSNGNFIWGYRIENASYTSVESIHAANTGKLYISGGYIGTADFDLSSSTYNLTSNGGLDAFVLCMDKNANFIWAKSFGGNSVHADIAHGIVTDQNSNVYTVGRYAGTVDFDPNTGIVNKTANGVNDIFVHKMDSSGNFLWVRTIGGGGDDWPGAIDVDNESNVYFTGKFENTVDANTGPGVLNFVSKGSTDILLEKLDKNGNFIWGQQIGGSGIDECTTIRIDQDNSIFTTGKFSYTVDFDPGPDTFNLIAKQQIGDPFVLKWNQDSCANFAFQFDSVSNISCVDSGYAQVKALHGYPPYTYSWNTSPVIHDTVAHFPTVGAYTITASDTLNCSISTTLHISGPSTQTNFDLNANLVAGDFRPGYSSQLSIDAMNKGCQPVNGQLKLVNDTILTLSTFSIPPDTIIGDTLIWNFFNFDFDSPHILPSFTYITSSAAQIGDSVCLKLMMTPIANDADSSNNIKEFYFPVTNSFDPNDKQVYPQGVCKKNYTLKNQPLTYTIRFQNLGNANALEVNIIDSLNSFLDVSTLNVISSSHHLFTEILDSNILKFRFENINLPYESIDKYGSIGYVIFEISNKPGLADSIEIENKSYIYFDNNLPIVTNTTLNTMVSELPKCKTRVVYPNSSPVNTTNNFYLPSGIHESKPTDKLKVFPNPTMSKLNIECDAEVYSLNIYSITGNLIDSHGVSKEVDVSELKKGVYFIEVNTQYGRTTKKFIKN